MNNEGIVLDPEIDDVLDSEHDPNNPANRDYFANAANEENINRLLAGAQLGMLVSFPGLICIYPQLRNVYSSQIVTR